MKNNNRFALLSLVVLILVTACNPVSTATVAPTVAVSTNTATPTLTPTATATPSPTATATSIPEPSPTPEGYFSNHFAGFSLTYPTTWEIGDSDARQLVLIDLNGNIIVNLKSYPEDEKQKRETVFETVLAELGEADETEVIKYGSTELGDDISADKVEYMVKAGPAKLDVWIYYAHRNKRAYVITIMGKAGDLSDRESTIERVLGSMELFPPQPMGLPSEETIVQVGYPPDAESLDPAVTGTSAADYVGLMFSGLVRISPEMQVVPELAESWEINDDGTVYTFTLRENLQFASGEPITAQHVADSWTRALDDETESTTAMTYLGDILGAKEMHEGDADEVSGLAVIDDRTLEVTLDGAKPYFLAKLSYPTAAVIDVAQAESDTEDWVFTADSSGPYRLKENREEEGLVFERNEHYFQPPAVTWLAYVFYPGSELVDLYEEGMLDLLPLSNEDIALISKEDHELHTELQTTPSMCTSMVRLNAALAPLDDPQVRKALLLAVDREAMLKQLTSSISLLPNGILPPAMPGAQADRSLPAFDPAAAKEALAQSKYAGQMLEITLNAAGTADSQREDVAMLVDQWQKNLPVRVKVAYLEPENYMTTAREKPGHALLTGWCADYPDPENFLDVLFHSESAFSVAPTADTELDALLEKARTETDVTERVALYQQAEDLILDNVYAIPLEHDMVGMLVKPRVKGYQVPAIHLKILPLLSLESEK